eukprot:595611-Amphidinium_carterae.1
MHAPVTLFLRPSVHKLNQPEPPTQSKRGGRAKTFFLMQTERQGASRPHQGPPVQSIHHNGEPPALPGGGYGCAAAPPA